MNRIFLGFWVVLLSIGSFVLSQNPCEFPPNLNVTNGQLSWFFVGPAEACFNSIAYNHTIATETLTQLRNVLDFYAFVDINKNTGPPFFQFVNLESSLDNIESTFYFRDYDFHLSVAQSFHAAGDAHTTYRLPRSYRDILVIRPFRVDSRLNNVTNEQEIFVYSETFLTTVPAATPVASLVGQNGAPFVGRRLLAIQGLDILTWFQVFGGRIGDIRDPSTRFNLALRVFHSCRLGPCDIPSLTETYTFENVHGNGTEDFVIPNILLSLSPHLNDSFIRGLAASEHDFEKREEPEVEERTPLIGTTPFEENEIVQELFLVPDVEDKRMEQKKKEYIESMMNKNTSEKEKKEKEEQKLVGETDYFNENEEPILLLDQFQDFNFSDPTNTVRCAFLTNDRNQSYVLLRIASFSGSVNGSANLFGQEFIRTMITCLQQGADSDRLLVDVRRNGGGFISLAALAQLAIVPEWNPSLNNDLFSPYDIRKTPLTDAFVANLLGDQYMDPTVVPATQFPSATRNTINAGWYSPTIQDLRGGVIGNYTPKAYFGIPSAEFPTANTFLLNNLLPRKYSKIIIFSDGLCGSSCSIFVSRLRYHGKVSIVSAGGVYPSLMDTSIFAGGNSIGSWNDFIVRFLAYNGANQPLAQALNIRPFPTSADCGFLLREFYLGNENVPRELQSYEGDCHLWEWDHLREANIGDYYNRISLLFDSPSCVNVQALGTQFGEEPLTILTRYGPVRGFIEGVLRIWLGIPYAKPPIGNLRWKLPQAPDSWSQTLDTTTVRPVCYQFNSRLGVYEGSEDCLTVNVYAPKTPYSRTFQAPDSSCTTGEIYYTVVQGDWLSKIARRFGVTWQQIYQWNSDKIENPNLIYPGQIFLIKCPSVPVTTSLRPVLVSIHPGDFNQGNSRDDPAQLLAEEGDVVVVTFNYRLGVFGFLSYPNVEPNIGLKDQQFALRWVRENIEYFGGDPERVAIMGGSSIPFQLLMSESHSLFQSAIIQSAYHWVNPPYITMKLLGVRFAKHVGCFDPSGSLECMGSKTPEQLHAETSSVSDLQISDPQVSLEYENGTTPSELHQQLILDLIDKILDTFKDLGNDVSTNTDDTSSSSSDPIRYNEIFVPVVGKGTDFRYDVLSMLKDGTFNKEVDIILGHNKQEFDNLISFDSRIYPNDYEDLIEEKFSILSDETIEMVQDTYKSIGRRDGWDRAVVQALSDAYFNCPLDEAARFILKNTRETVYRYLFTQESSNLLEELEPAYGLERAYIFKNAEADIPNSIDVLDATDEQLADDIIGWWTEFAFSGDPTSNKPRSRKWKPFVTNGPPSERNLAKDLSRKPRMRNPLPQYVEMKPNYYPACARVWKQVLSTREFYSSGKWTAMMFKRLFEGDGAFLAEVETPSPTAPPLDRDNDRIPDIYETNTGIYVSPTDTGTDPDSDDTDHDGLRDGDEVYGTEDGLDLPGMGCNPLRYDILLEHDWMIDSIGCGNHSHRPTEATLDAVTFAFANASVNNVDGTTGINVIHDYGQGGLFTGGNYVEDDGTLTGNGVNGAEFLSIKNVHFANSRKGYFHYVLHIHNIINSTAIGIAEVRGDDVVTSLGCLWNHPFYPSVTLMHELGHNLGLLHGGDTSCNHKPNYNSIMNYRFAIGGGIAPNCSTIEPGTALDYSYGTRNAINESNIIESDGVCDSIPIDFDASGGFNDGYALNLNPTQDSFCGGALTVLEDFNDWSNLEFDTLRHGDKRDITTQITCMEFPPEILRPAGWSPDE